MKALLHLLLFVYSIFGWKNGLAEDISFPDTNVETGPTNFALHRDFDSCFHPSHEDSTAEYHHRMKRCGDSLQSFKQQNRAKSQSHIVSTHVQNTDFNLHSGIHRPLRPRPKGRAAHRGIESTAQADMNISQVALTVPSTTDSTSSHNFPEQIAFNTTDVPLDQLFANIVSSKTLNPITNTTSIDESDYEGDYEINPETQQGNQIFEKITAARFSDLSEEIRSVLKLDSEENLQENTSTRTHIAQSSVTPLETYYVKGNENKKNPSTFTPELTSKLVYNYAHEDQMDKSPLIQNQNWNSMVFSLNQAPALEVNTHFTTRQETVSQLGDNFESSSHKQVTPDSYLIQHQTSPLNSIISTSSQTTEPDIGSHFSTPETVNAIHNDLSIHKSRTQHQNHLPKSMEFISSKDASTKIETHSPISKAARQIPNQPSNGYPIHKTYLTQHQTPPFNSLAFSSSHTPAIRVNYNFTSIPNTESPHLNNHFKSPHNYQIHMLHRSQHQPPVPDIMAYSQVPVSEINSHLTSTPKAVVQLHKNPSNEYPIHKSHLTQHQTSFPNSMAFTSSQTPLLQVNSDLTPKTMRQHLNKHFKSSHSPQIQEPYGSPHPPLWPNTMAFSHNQTSTPVIDPHLTFTPEADSQFFNNSLNGYLIHKSAEPSLSQADALVNPHFTSTPGTLNQHPKYHLKSSSHEHPYHKSHHTQAPGYGISLKASAGFPDSIVRSPLPSPQLLPPVSESDSSIEEKCAIHNPQPVASYQMFQPEFSLIEHTFEAPTRIVVTDDLDLRRPDVGSESSVNFSGGNTRGYDPTTNSPDEVELITPGETKPSILQKNVTTSYDIQSSVEELEKEIETLEDQSTSEKPSNYFPETRKPSVTSSSDPSSPAVTIPVWSGEGRLPSNPILVTIPREDGKKLTLTDEAGIENVADFVQTLSLNQGNLNGQTFSYPTSVEPSNGMYDPSQKYTNYGNSMSMLGLRNTFGNDEEHLPSPDSSDKQDTLDGRSVSRDDFRETIQEIINSSPTESTSNSRSDLGTQLDRLVDDVLEHFENSDQLPAHPHYQKLPGEDTSVTLGGSIITNRQRHGTKNKDRQFVPVNPNDNWKIVQDDASIQPPVKEIQRKDNSSVSLIWTPHWQYIPTEWFSYKHHSNTSPSDARNVSNSSTGIVSLRKLTNRSSTADLLHKINSQSEKNLTIDSSKDGILDRSSIQLEMANNSFNRMGVTPKGVNQPLNSNSSQLNQSNAEVINRKNKSETGGLTKNYHNIFIIGENDADTLRAILSSLGIKPSKTEEEVIADENGEQPILSRSVHHEPLNEDVMSSHIAGSSGPTAGAVESIRPIYGATPEHEPINKSLKKHFHFVNPGILSDFAEVYNRYASKEKLSGDLNSKRAAGKGRTSSNDDPVVKTLRQLVKLRSSIPKILTSRTHRK